MPGIRVIKSLRTGHQSIAGYPPAEVGTHFIDLVWKESRFNFGEKEGHKNVEHSAESGFEPGTCGCKAQILPLRQPTAVIGLRLREGQVHTGPSSPFLHINGA